MQKTQRKITLFKAILISGLIAGTLDILAAIIQTLISGRNPVTMLKFIASGVFGKSALSGGLQYAYYGLFFHYCISFVWTIILFLFYPLISSLTGNKILIGIGYGLLVWVAMSMIVLPLSQAPGISLSFSFLGAIKSIGILIVAVGLPISFMASKYYVQNKN